MHLKKAAAAFFRWPTKSSPGRHVVMDKWPGLDLDLRQTGRGAQDPQERQHVGGHGLEGSLVKDFNTKDDPWEPVMGPKQASKVPPKQPYEPSRKVQI